MSKWITKLLTVFIIIAVIIAAITSCREKLLSSSVAYDAFVAIFDCFPFAKEMAELAAYIGQYGITMSGLTPSNVLNDIAKIFAMAIVCPIIIGGISRMFLRVPYYKDWYAREQYMNGLGYRFKESMLNIILMPVCACLTAWAIDALQITIQSKAPLLGPEIISIVIVVMLFGASVIFTSVSRSISVGLLVKHRLIVDLIGGILKIVGMNMVSFFIALAILNERSDEIIGLLVILIIYLTGLDLLIKSIMRSTGTGGE